MKAFIKQEYWDQFKENCNKYKFYAYSKSKKYFVKIIDEDVILTVNKKTRELQLQTPMGYSPFMEVHKETYKDLYDEGFVEFEESRFD